MVNSNVPHLRTLVSLSCIEIIVQVKILILSSFRSNKHMMAPLSALSERSDYKLVHLNSCSYNGETVQLQSALNDDYNNFSGKSKHVQHFRVHSPILALERARRSSFIDSFNSAKTRCNTSQGFGAFFGQSCDCDRVLFPFISEFLSLFFLFLDFTAISDCVSNNKNKDSTRAAGYQIIITILAVTRLVAYLSYPVPLRCNLRVPTRVYDA